MKRVLNLLIVFLSGAFLSVFLLLLCYFFFFNHWKINIFSSYGWGYILNIANNRLHVNIMYGMGFISLLIGLTLICLSTVFIFCLDVYNLLSKKCASQIEKKPQRRFYQGTVKKDNNKNIFLQSEKHELSSDFVQKEDSDNDEQEIKTEKKFKLRSPEIPLPKSIMNSDAYSLVQKMQNNNKNILNIDADNSKASVKEVKQENPDVKNDELRRRILKKFNTSLEDVKIKKEPNSYKKEKKNE